MSFKIVRSDDFSKEFKSNALVSEHDGTIYLLLIYDKADASTVKINVVMDVIKELGL